MAVGLVPQIPAPEAYRRVQGNKVTVSLGGENLCLCHSINKRNLSFFFKKRSIVLQRAVGTIAVSTVRWVMGRLTLSARRCPNWA